MVPTVETVTTIRFPLRAPRLIGSLRALPILLMLLTLAGPASAETKAKALESRLYAPCCYGGTLDMHDSELAHSLRAELEARLARGERGDTIQADFVARYGDAVLAARSDRPIRQLGAVVSAALVLSALALAWAVRKWTRRSDAVRVTRARGERDAFDDRIDAELAELDG